MAQYAKIYCKLHFCQLIIINMENEENHTDIIHRCAMYIIVKSCKRCARSCRWNNNVVLHLSSATCMRHRLLPERAILRSKRFQFLLVPAHGAAAIHRNTGPPIKVWSRAHDLVQSHIRATRKCEAFTPVFELR